MGYSLVLVFASVCAEYLYPTYATYKVLTAASRKGSTLHAYNWHASSNEKQEPHAEGSEKPTELAELESLCMYWAVIAVMRVVETFGEWSWKWYVLRRGVALTI